MNKMIQSSSGIQLWNHDGYAMYKCKGPYVPSWGDPENWHPSILGHELRAAHYSFFWLSIYRDALQGILLRLTAKVGAGTVEVLLTKTKKHFDHEHSQKRSIATYTSDYADNMQCLTSFLPINDQTADLGRYLINNIGENPIITKPFFSKVIVEDLMDEDIVTKALRRGYKDFKYTYYGNVESKPLSIKIHVQKEGVVFLCQPPPTWGALPDGFRNFWELPTRMYLTSNISASIYERYESMEDALNPLTATPDRLLFLLHSNSAKLVEFKNIDKENLCSQSMVKIPSGRHVLTVVPSTKDNIMISTVLVP